MFEKKENFKQTVNPPAIVPQLAAINIQEKFEASEPKESKEVRAPDFEADDSSRKLSA